LKTSKALKAAISDPPEEIAPCYRTTAWNNQSAMQASNPARPNYRVVQWATGNIGTRAMRAVIEHPDMTLVGVHVYSEDKAGRDAGELCGLAPVGVTATRYIDEIIALEPDCVLYVQEGCNFDDVCRLLASGANIVTTRGEFQNPARLDPAMRERVIGRAIALRGVVI
jgi:2,4-diaminopentanoate dehydrogenase